MVARLRSAPWWLLVPVVGAGCVTIAAASCLALTSKNLTVFTPLLSMLSFPHIADHAFRLAAVAVGTPKVGRPYEFRIFAAHPTSNRPVQGVRVSINDVSATTDTNGAAIIRLTPTLVDWADPDDVTVVGQLGDLKQTAVVPRPALPPNAVRIYTDKPLYQPGQRWDRKHYQLTGGGRL